MKGKNPMSNILTIQRTGKKPGSRAIESQDRLATRLLSQGTMTPATLMIVADGITNGSFGGSVARYVVDRHLAIDEIPAMDASNMHLVFPQYLSSLYETFKLEFADMPDMLMSGACLVAMVIVENQWVCCSIGDCEAFVLKRTDKGYSGEKFTRPHIDRLSSKLTDCFGGQLPCIFNVHGGSMDDQSIIVLTSDGAKLDEFSLNDVFQSHGFTDAALIELADNAMCGRFWDDISIIAYRHDERTEN